MLTWFVLHDEGSSHTQAVDNYQAYYLRSPAKVILRVNEMVQRVPDLAWCPHLRPADHFLEDRFPSTTAIPSHRISSSAQMQLFLVDIHFKKTSASFTGSLSGTACRKRQLLHINPGLIRDDARDWCRKSLKTVLHIIMVCLQHDAQELRTDSVSAFDHIPRRNRHKQNLA